MRYGVDRTRARWRAGLLALTSLVLAAPLANAQESTTSSARIDELVRLAAARFASGQPQPIEVVRAAGDQSASGVSLRFDDAVRLALEHNLDISVQRLNPETIDYSLAGLHATYRPTVTSLFGNNSQVNPPTSTLNGGTRVEQTTLNYNAGLTQNSPWGGSSLSVTWNNNRQTTSNLFANYNPAYTTTFRAQFTQPLLRGFKIDSTRQQLAVTKLSRDISDVQLKATIINVLSNVRNAYWDLVFAVQSVDVARRSLDLADKLVEDNKTRVEIGTMAPIDVIQAQSEAATRRQNLVQATATRRTAELSLKRLIVAGTQDPIWTASIDPIDRPEFQAEAIDLEGAVRRALAERTDLAQAKANMQSNDITMKFLRNQMLPQADIVGFYGGQGLGGTQAVRSGSGVDSAIKGYLPGGYLDALSALGGRNFPNWNIGVNFSYPIGTSTAEASVARARVQLRQSEAQLHQIELQVATEVTNAALSVQSNLERVQASKAARELSEKRLEAEQSKFEVGMSTNFFVVQAQRDLSDSQNSELQAMLNYRKSLVDFERLQQTTLQNSGVTILGSGGLNLTAVGSGRPTVVAGGS